MSADWFKEFVFEVVVDRSIVPKEVLQVFDQNPILLPGNFTNNFYKTFYFNIISLAYIFFNRIESIAWDPFGSLAFS